MPRIIEKTVYQFDELTDEAKEKARQWYRESDDGYYLDNVISDFSQIAEIIGLELSTRSVPLMNGKTRQEPEVYYSVAYSQGDYAAFTGTWRYEKGSMKALREYAPVDTVLRSILADFNALQKRFFYRLAVDCSERRGNQYVNNVYRRYTSRYDEQAVDRETEREAENIVDRLSSWLYTQLRNEVDYQNSDEQVDESIRANEYEFSENGERV